MCTHLAVRPLDAGRQLLLDADDTKHVVVDVFEERTGSGEVFALYLTDRGEMRPPSCVVGWVPEVLYQLCDVLLELIDSSLVAVARMRRVVGHVEDFRLRCIVGTVRTVQQLVVHDHFQVELPGTMDS